MRTALLLFGLALAAAPAPGSDADKITKLVEQLGADSFADREAASKALEKVGTPALEAVRKATKSTDAEVRKRAIELAGKLGRRAASDAALTPKMVHLTYKDTPVADAVKDFREKSGYDIVLADPEGKLKDKKVTLNTGKVTFWAAMEKFRDAAGVAERERNVGSMPPMGIMVPPVGPRAIRILPAPPPPPAGGAAPPPPPIAPPPPAPKDKVEKEAEAKKEAAKEREVAVRLARAVAALEAPQPPAPPAGGPAAGKPMAAPAAVLALALEESYYVQVPLGQITLVPGEDKLKGDNSSSFRVRQADRKRFAPGSDAREVAVMLEVSAEPRLQIQSITSVTIDAAEDDAGQKLKQVDTTAPAAAGPLRLPGGGVVVGGGRILAPAGGVGYYPPSSNRVHNYSTVRLTKGAKASKSLANLEGTFTASVLFDREAMLTLAEPAKAAGKAIEGKDGGSIRVTDVSKVGGSTQIKFEFVAPEDTQPETSYTAATAPAADRPSAGGGAMLPVMIPGQSGKLHAPWGLTLQTDKGEALMASIRPGERKPGGPLAYIATYDPARGEAANLVYTARRLAQVTVPFKLTGVELK